MNGQPEAVSRPKECRKLEPLAAGQLFIIPYHVNRAMVCLLCVGAAVCMIAACANRDEARNQAGLRPVEDPESHIPSSTPGPGWERIEKRADATPTPKPTNPMDRPLDPTGLPSG